jgi:hypothetical protein
MMLAFLPLSYLAAAPDFRLLDTELARLDVLLFGFEWDAAARWSPIVQCSTKSCRRRTSAPSTKLSPSYWLAASPTPATGAASSFGSLASVLF